MLSLSLVMPLLVAQAPADRARQLERDALISYGFALVQQRDDRLVTAAAQLEEAIRLDPPALPPRIALVPLLSALGRTEEAMTAAATVLSIDPAQAPTARWLARIQLEQGRTAEAAETLERCLAAPAMRDRPAELAAVLRELGPIRELQKKPNAAAQAYRQALERLTDDRDRAETWIALGRVLRDPSCFESARDVAGKLGGPSTPLRIDYHLAAMLAERGDLREADKALNQYLATKPRDLPAFELQARLARQLNDPVVFGALERSARNDADFTPLVALLGNEYRHRGDWSRAEAAFLSVVTRQPHVAAYRGLLAGYGANDIGRAMALVESRLSAARHDPRGARGDHARAILAALRQEPNLVRPLIDEADRNARNDAAASVDSLRLWATVALRCGAPAQAERLFLAALRRGDRDAEFAILDGLLQALEQQRKWAPIVDACRQCLAAGRAPRPEYYWRWQSQALLRLDRIDDALAAADRGMASAFQANIPVLRLQRIHVQIHAERLDEADAAIQAWLAEGPAPETLRKIQITQARLLAQSGRFESAELILRGVAISSPDDPVVQHALGTVLIERNSNLPEAERLCRRAAELDRREKKDSLDDEGPAARYLGSVGWALVRLGRYSEGRGWLERSVARPDGTQDATQWDRLGDACWRLGDRAAAAAAWSRARDLAALDKRSLRDPRPRQIEQKLQQGLLNH